MRRVESLMAPRGVTLTAVRFWAGRAVLAWAVLAGLFFMHGAALPGDGCQGGTLMATTGARALMPDMQQVVAMRTVADPAAGRTPARAAMVPGVRAAPSATAMPGATSMAAASGDGGMLCTSRQPRHSLLGALGIPPAGAVLFTVAILLACRAVASRRNHPPGRPGLPLPLFLGVSRT
jgi:hypothetical protein